MDFKVGDKVRCLSSFEYLVEGRVYTVVETERYDGNLVLSLRGLEFYRYFAIRFELFKCEKFTITAKRKLLR